MNRFFLIFTLLFCILFSQGQKNVKKYYEYVNKAELAICDFKYEKAFQHLHISVMTQKKELKQMMQEIDEEHQKGIYKREYVIREKK
jgi:hypothetical protein